MKLLYIPNFSKYRIIKTGDIYEYDTMKKIYTNGSANGLPKLINDFGEMKQLTRNDIAAAYYGTLPNSYVECKLGALDHSSKSIAYIIENINIVSNDIIMINENKFKKIKNCSRYYVSEYGVVYSLIMKAFNRYNISEEYYMLNLRDDNGNVVYKYIHHLVYEAYCGIRTKHMTINHIDEHKWNNYYKNLNELTYAENTKYSRKRISDSYESFLKNGAITWHPDLLHWMCDQMANHNRSASDICDMLGITHERDRSKIISMLYSLRSGKANTDISSQYDFSNYCPNTLRKKSLQKYSEHVYRAIDYLIKQGKTNVEISTILGIPRQTVYSYRILNSSITEGSTTIEKISI